MASTPKYRDATHASLPAQTALQSYIRVWVQLFGEKLRAAKSHEQIERILEASQSARIKVCCTAGSRGLWLKHKSERAFMDTPFVYLCREVLPSMDAHLLTHTPIQFFVPAEVLPVVWHHDLWVIHEYARVVENLTPAQTLAGFDAMFLATPKLIIPGGGPDKEMFHISLRPLSLPPNLPSAVFSIMFDASYLAGWGLQQFDPAEAMRPEITRSNQQKKPS